jgi:hypothetical protein
MEPARILFVMRSARILKKILAVYFDLKEYFYSLRLITFYDTKIYLFLTNFTCWSK